MNDDRVNGKPVEMHNQAPISVKVSEVQTLENDKKLTNDMEIYNLELSSVTEHNCTSNSNPHKAARLAKVENFKLICYIWSTGRS